MNQGSESGVARLPAAVGGRSLAKAREIRARAANGVRATPH